MENAIYVTDGKGYFLVQVEDNTQFGFSLLDDDQAWPGGFGSGMQSWHYVPKSAVPRKVRRRLDFLLEENE